MPTKRKVKMRTRLPAKSSSSKGQSVSAALENKINSLTSTINKMTSSDRQVKLSGLGRLAFDAGNSISSFFGAGKIFGSGAYKMSGGNTAWDTASQVPVMHSSSNSVRVCHREYLGDVLGSTGFSNSNQTTINPGLAQSFPYLSNIASNFQEYRFRGLVFEYKTTSGEFGAASTALGSVMMVCQYRVDAEAPTTKMQVLNEMWSTDGKPSQDNFLPIECDPKQQPLSVSYIRSKPLSSTQDPKFYDIGMFYLCTNGNQAATLQGELWVTYDVELYKPVLALTTGPYSGNGAHAQYSGCTTALPFGTVTAFNRNWGVTITTGLTGVTGTLSIIAETGQRYYVEISYHSATSCDLAQATLSGGTRVAYYNTAAVDSIESGAGTTENQLTQFLEASGGVLTLGITATIVGACVVDITVIQVADEFV